MCIHICIHTYTYIYICCSTWEASAGPYKSDPPVTPLLHPARIRLFRASPPDPDSCPLFGRHYLSNATCLIRPHLFFACFVASRITITCYMIRHF